MSIYLDNSATTPLDPEVFEAMRPFLENSFGNPSSTHAHGREAKSAIELARKKVAGLLGAKSNEIYFTSGGTEADNTVIRGLVHEHNIRHIITTGIEHHAVLHTVGELNRLGVTKVSFLELDKHGEFRYDELEKLVRNNPGSLVTLMHANNEIGNLIDLKETGRTCRENDAFLHSDTVQSVGRYEFNLNETPVDSVVGSAHKFHGPKGIGFFYLRSDVKINPLLQGGGQERNLRSGTEHVAGIAGLARALEISYEDLEKKKEYISNLKEKLISGLKKTIPGIKFNGLSGEMQDSLYSLINASLPGNEKNEMILFQMDLHNISISGGSACESGALRGSHVINAIDPDPERTAIRFSFSKYNTVDEIDYTLEILKKILS